MKRTLFAIAALTLAAAPALADVVKPGEVQFDEYGAVAQSLSGTPGDPVNGRKVMTTRGLGNCIACHEVTALKEFPFHGEVGPPLDGAGDRWAESDLRGIVANAKMMFDGTMMPSFYKDTGFIRIGNAYTGKAGSDPTEPLLSAQQIEDVVAYLMTLKDN